MMYVAKLPGDQYLDGANNAVDDPYSAAIFHDKDTVLPPSATFVPREPELRWWRVRLCTGTCK